MAMREAVRDDGLRVITRTIPGTKRVLLSATANAGYAHDPEGLEGVNHMFEHMAFKGTTSRSLDEINNTLARYFTNFGASTSVLSTTYRGEGIFRRQENIAGLLFDLYNNPSFPESEFEKEKLVVLDEIAKVQASDFKMSYHYMMQALCRENPVAIFGAGTPESVMGLKTNNLVEAHARSYIPSNSLVIGVGNVDHAALVDQAFSAFPFDPRTLTPDTWQAETDLPPIQPETVICRPGKPRSLIAIGCKLPASEKSDGAAMILSSLLGGKGIISMIDREIRGKRGLAYSSKSMVFSPQYSLGNFLMCIADTKPENAGQVKDLMLRVMCGQPIDSGDFERTMEVTQDTFEIGIESPSQWESLLRRRALDERGSVFELRGYAGKAVRELAKVSLDDVNRLREKYLVPERLATVVIAP